MTRRQAILLTSATLRAQRLVPVDELVNAFEMEAMAQRKLAPGVFEEIAGGDRAAFDRITLRPRLMVNTLGLDLSIDLFGQRLFAPILVGPTALHGRFHPEAERATLEGATAARTTVAFAAKTTLPIDKLTAPATTPFWLQVDPANAQPALQLGAKALIVTLTGAPFDWKSFDRLLAATKTPVLIKGVMTAKDAQLAVQRGARGLIVSNHRTPPTSGFAAPIDALPAIAAETKVPVLIDGGFRRGSDILKALALGARAVLLGRPPLWGLAAYGARGVQQVIEQLQTELARDMAMCGAVRCDRLSPQHVKLHRR